MEFKYHGFYKRTKESDKNQPKYRYFYVENDLLMIKTYDKEGNLLSLSHVKNFNCVNCKVHHKTEEDGHFVETSKSQSYSVITKDQRASVNYGFGQKFEKPAMKYHSTHQYSIINDMTTYSNSYTFENGDISKAEYIRIGSEPKFN